MITITRKGLTLSIDASIIPAQGSSNVPVQYIDDKDTYAGFTPQLSVGWITYNGLPKATIMQQDDDSNYLIPAEAFKNSGNIYIAAALINDDNPNHIEYTLRTQAIVTPAPNGTVILPSDDEWQKVVKDYIDELFEKNYGPQFDQIQQDLENLVEEAQNQQDKANQQQTQIDNAINVMGDYEIVSEDPTQIRFKKGNGEFGDTVDLGDGLASKNMVNAGYYQSVGSQYSGSASDYGIEVARIEGAYKQDGTPTPEAPIEPQFFHATAFNTNGGNLFDASKLPSKAQGGAYVLNNGDGSFYPFNASSTPVDIELRALPNGVKDTYENGLITRRVGVATFDGSDDEPWATGGMISDGVHGYYISIPTIIGNSDGDISNDMICNRYIQTSINNALAKFGYFRRGGGGQNKATYFYNDISSLADWKNNLKSNPITVWYELATPTTEQYQIPVLPSYYPFTNAWCDSELETNVTWNVLTGKSAILDGQGNLIQKGYITPNDNLLANSDWKSGIINQKGETSYGYVDTPLMTIDKWLSYGVNVAIDVTNVRVVNRQTSARTLRQYVNGDSGIYTVYVNVKTISGNVYVNLNNDTSKNKKLVQGENIFQITVLSTETLKSLALYLEANADVYIYSIKLEKGSYFTGMPLWNETIELLKCMGYFQKLYRVPLYTTNSTGITYLIPKGLYIPMVNKPSIQLVEILNSSAQPQQVTIKSSVIEKDGVVNITLSGGIGQYGYITCYFDGNNY